MPQDWPLFACACRFAHDHRWHISSRAYTKTGIHSASIQNGSGRPSHVERPVHCMVATTGPVLGLLDLARASSHPEQLDSGASGKRCAPWLQCSRRACTIPCHLLEVPSIWAALHLLLAALKRHDPGSRLRTACACWREGVPPAGPRKGRRGSIWSPLLPRSSPTVPRGLGSSPSPEHASTLPFGRSGSLSP